MKKAPATLKPKKLYRWITWHRNLEQAVFALSTPQLKILNGYLARSGAASGVPSLIQGLILWEMAGRFMIEKDARKP